MGTFMNTTEVFNKKFQPKAVDVFTVAEEEREFRPQILTARGGAIVEIIGGTPVNLLNSTLLAVLPTWGPIYEFSFEFRLNCELVPLCEITDINKGLSYSDTMAGRIYWTGNYYTGFQTDWSQPWNYRKKANRINVFHLLNGILSFSTQDPPSAF